ncbi:hypothetical protein OROHE_016015 [Orobanche hederae]
MPVAAALRIVHDRDAGPEWKMASAVPATPRPRQTGSIRRQVLKSGLREESFESGRVSTGPIFGASAATVTCSGAAISVSLRVRVLILS